MSVKILRFVSLLLVTLIFGLAFCHVMEIPGKRLSGLEWLVVQQNLYVSFGSPIGAGIEVAAIVLTWILVFLARGPHVSVLRDRPCSAS